MRGGGGGGGGGGSGTLVLVIIVVKLPHLARIGALCLAVSLLHRGLS